MVECPVWLRDILVPAGTRDGDIILCPHCKIYLRIVFASGEWSAERVPEAR